MQLRNRTVLITGASSGIGRQLALLLAKRGCRLILVGRHEQRLATVAEAVSGNTIVTDLARPDAVATLCRRVARDHPEVSVLINNAGVQLNGRFAGAEDSDRLLQDIAFETQVDLIAPIQLCASLLPLLSQQSIRSGTPSAVVNLSTGLALAPKQSAAVYCAAKAGLRTFTQAFRFQAESELKRGGADVRAVDVVLPLVDTPMTEGRGTGKLRPETAAASIVRGLERGQSSIFVGKARLLRCLNRLAPGWTGRMFRHI